MKSPSFLKKIINDKRGVTIIIALGLCFLLLYYAISTGNIVRENIRQIKAFNEQWQAQLIGDAINEALLLASRDHEAGYSTTDCETLLNAEFPQGSSIAKFLDDPNVDINCAIEGKNDIPVDANADGDEQWYTVPKANTGDASEVCSPFISFLTSSQISSYYGSGALATFFNGNPLDHPCHWGKLNFGNNFSGKVVIPLYYQGDNGIVNPADFEQADFLTGSEFTAKLRLRTPCKPIKDRDICKQSPEDIRCKYKDVCADEDRYEFYTGNGQIDDNKTLAIWQISGDCLYNLGENNEKTEICAVFANDEVRENTRTPENTEIYESLFNETKGDFYPANTDDFKYVFLNVENYLQSDIFHKKLVGKDLYDDYLRDEDERTPLIYDFLTDGGVYENHREITKPSLQFAIIVNEMFSDDNDEFAKRRIPYLEYQLITNHEISNVAQRFEADVVYGNHGYRLREDYEYKKSVADFAVQN